MLGVAHRMMARPDRWIVRRDDTQGRRSNVSVPQMVPPEAASSPFLRRLASRQARFVAGVVLLVLVGFFVPQMYRRMARAQGNDLTVYLESARALMRGDDPYAIALPQGHAPYPLTIDTLVIPLTWVPAWLAQALWFGANATALVVSVLILERLWASSPSRPSLAATIPVPVRLTALMVALVTPFQSQFTLGQMDLVTLCFCCLFCRADVAGRRQEASMWLGGAIALKLTPLVFVLGLARRRQYRMLVLTAGWAVLWAVALPALASDRVLPLYGDAWIRVLRSRVEAPVSLDWSSRFTLAAALTYVVPPSAAIPGLRYWAAAAVVAPVAVAEGWVAHDPRGRLMSFAVTLAAIPLVSPISETHHLTMLTGALWLWMLAAGTPPFMRVLDLLGVALFLTSHWIALGLAGPAAFRRASLFDFLALIALYLVLLVRTLSFRASPRLGLDGDPGRPARTSHAVP
jgi:hypothetical protein